MVGLRRGAARAALGVIVVSSLLVVLPAGVARAQREPPQPFAPDWAMLAGWTVFSEKGCGKCHSIRGTGGKVGPDLARIESGKSFFDIGADMWNHLPRMGARMREAGIERPTLTPIQMSNLIAFIFTAQYYDEPGDVRRGEQQFTQKGCVQCHEVGGKGGHVGPPLDTLKRANSPVLVAAAMWNHGPRMAEVMASKGIARPTFDVGQLRDLIAYIVAAGRDVSGETSQVVPGTPERGQKLFAEKRCATCHAVAGKGPSVGPDLGRSGHHASLTEFAARMWNHGPAMWAKMKERGVEIPSLTGQEMADIVAYLYVSHYFDPMANPRRGQELVRTKGCLSCHKVAGKGGSPAGDFATSTVVRTPGGLVAGMWNHSRFMESQAQKQHIAWPVLTGRELGDIAAYLASLSKPASAKPGGSKPASK